MHTDYRIRVRGLQLFTTQHHVNLHRQQNWPVLQKVTATAVTKGHFIFLMQFGLKYTNPAYS